MSNIYTWTDERVEMLKKLWHDGLSASQIAGELGKVTRNAVIGKIHRLELTGRAKAPTSSTPRGSKNLPRQRPSLPAPPATQRAFRQAESLAVAEAAMVPAPKVPFLEQYQDSDAIVPMGERCTMMELKEYSCRWPIGDPCKDDFRYCGARSSTGVAYCMYHARIAYQPVSDRRRDRSNHAVSALQLTAL